MILFENHRDAPPVDDEALVHVLSWRALVTAEHRCHLVILRHSQTVRCTTAIEAIDPSCRTLITASGRRYVLHVPPERDPITRAILLCNAMRSGLSGAVDISDDLWSKLQQSGAEASGDIGS